jgi:hypothetical protein
MPNRVPTISVVVIRKDEKTGKNVRKTPPLNKSFPFTDDEVKSILAQHPGALRKAVNETVDEVAGHTSDDSQPGKEASSRSAPEGNKKPTAGKGTKAKAKAAAQEREATGGGGTDAADDDTVDADEDETAGDDAADEDEDI